MSKKIAPRVQLNFAAEEISDEEWLSMASICDEVVIKLKTKGYKDSLLGEAKELFYREKFEEQLDERHELLGFENGVIDLDKRIFREGRPDDWWAAFVLGAG